MVGTTFDGAMYANAGQDLVQSERPILTRICRGIHVGIFLLSVNFEVWVLESQSFTYKFTNIDFCGFEPANPDHKNLCTNSDGGDAR